MKHVLSIAGSDCSGGAGIQADLKTFSALGVYGMTVITAITAQNTRGVTAVKLVSPEMITAQIDAIFDDIRVDAVKIGMIGSTAHIFAVVACLKRHNPVHVIVDPVMMSKSGHSLLETDAQVALSAELLPLADLITPNIPEAEALSGIAITTQHQMAQAGRIILDKGAHAVLVKGGHLNSDASDILVLPSGHTVFVGTRINATHTHGTGCSLSSAIAPCLARGMSVTEAIAFAKDWVRTGIEQGLAIGKGIGPIHHFHQWWPGVTI